MKSSPGSSGAGSPTLTYTPLALPSSLSTNRSASKATVAACGATWGSSPNPMCAAEPPRLFSRWPRGNSVPFPSAVSSTSFAANGGGCSSGMGSATDSAGTASSAGTGALCMVASSNVSAPRSAAISIEGGGGAEAFFANGVPQSKQNFAAGGLRAPQLAQGLLAGSAAAIATASGGGSALLEGEGGAGGGLRAGNGPAAAAGRPSPTRGRAAGAGGARPDTANGSGGVFSEGLPFRAARVKPASAASSSEMASARSSSERVSGTCEGGVKPEAGVVSGAASPGKAKRGNPQFVQTVTPGSL